MLISETEMMDTNLLDDPSAPLSRQMGAANPSLEASTKRVLFLSEDTQEREQLEAWAGPLDVKIESVSSGTELLEALSRSLAGKPSLADGGTDPIALVVLGGQLPSWVYLDLIDRTKLRTDSAGAQDRKVTTPSFLLLLASSVIDGVFEHISTHHLDLHVDFVERPVRAAEFCVRAKRLLQMPQPGPGFSGATTMNTFETASTTSLDALTHPPVSFGPYTFDFKRHCVFLHGDPIRLSYREFALTWMLFSKMGQMVSRAELLQRLFMRTGTEATGKSGRSLDSYICRIRNNLQIGLTNGYALEAVYGQGYVVREV
jgi:DNA-binding response OmpR family regulator